MRLAEAKGRGERVFVHRCAWGTFPPVICCSALVSEVHDLDKLTAFVRFADVQTVDAAPPVIPQVGQNFYDASPPRDNA